ncbi:hypothetical protein M0812_07247 [Anaeramoeba flamelloides]|uniref:BED-type domain-containing protein n=1 Tax=Anaeramoeba flamelloides TaxID=1746091 RepID=A0AAV8A8J6_9EUKA|nr:hypothetical protein M0812_07247 [Anaeramoeba flamelloides]
MQNSTKPFPHNVNPIFLDTRNWHGGRYDLNKKQIGKQSYICKNCYNLWNSWNRFGSPKIQTLQEWIDNSKDPIENEDAENSSVSDGSDYIEEVEEEVHCGNLTHQPSYNEEKYRIYLMAQEANGKELRTTIFGSVKESKKEHEQEKRKEIYWRRGIYKKRLSTMKMN